MKQAIRERFEDIELSKEQLDELAARFAAEEPAPAKKPAWLRAPAAAAAMIVLAIGGLFSTQVYQSHQDQVLLQSIAEEVADNHLKLKPLEVQGDDLPSVLGYFTDLDFQLLASPRITANSGDRLLGGRYCTIQGIDAAQLRVAASDGTLSTWYEATLPADELKRIPDIDAGERPAEFVVRGVDIRIWQENGIVFAEAKAAGQ
jgi:anti-sigma factor RsiW